MKEIIRHAGIAIVGAVCALLLFGIFFSGLLQSAISSASQIRQRQGTDTSAEEILAKYEREEPVLEVRDELIAGRAYQAQDLFVIPDGVVTVQLVSAEDMSGEFVSATDDGFWAAEPGIYRMLVCVFADREYYQWYYVCFN